MSGYRFKARDPRGKRYQGVLQAATREEAERSLARQGLIPELVKPEPLDRSLQLRSTPNPRALVQFYQQFATLVDAGVPLLLSLEILQGLTSDRPLRRSIGAVSIAVQEGATLADALRRHPRVYDEIAVNLIEAGEEGGSLDSALERLSQYVERAGEVRDKVRGAMIYPAFILLVAVGAIVALLTLVVPTFEALFTASGASLPYATQLLVTTADFVSLNWPWLVSGTLLSVLVVKALYDTAAIRYVVHRVALRLPVVGRLVRKVTVARMSRTLASLIASGVGILDAMAAAARTAGNDVIQNAMMATRDSVAQGLDVSTALAQHSELPSLVSNMVGVGEQTGRMDQMFDKVADFFERESQAEIDGLLRALEPALVVLVGITLGGIVAAMYLPIFDAIGAIDPIGL